MPSRSAACWVVTNLPMRNGNGLLYVNELCSNTSYKSSYEEWKHYCLCGYHQKSLVTNLPMRNGNTPISTLPVVGSFVTNLPMRNGNATICGKDRGKQRVTNLPMRNGNI